MIQVLLLTFIFLSLQLQAQTSISNSPSNPPYTTGAIFKAPGNFQKKVYLAPGIFNAEPSFLSDIGYIPMNSDEGQKGCDNSTSIGFSTPKLDALGKMFLQMSCKEVDKLKNITQLDGQICLQLASCLQTKMKLGDSDRLELMLTAREKTARDAIAVMAKDAINPMFKFDELKKYAFDKFGPQIIPEVCIKDPLTIPEDGLCRTSTIDRGFEIAQQMCKVPEDGCQPKYNDFIEEKKTVEGQSSLLSEFIKKQSEKNSKNYMSNDSRITNDLAFMMTDKKIPPEVRVKNIMSYLGKNQYDLDPVFRSFFEESLRSVQNNKKDEVEEGLLKYIKSNSTKETLEVLVDLDRLREVKAREMLVEQCPKVMTLRNLCKIASDVMIGAEIVVPADNFERLLKRNNSFIKNPGISKAEMVQAVSHCNTFVLDTGTKIKKGLLTKLGGDRDLFSANDSGIFVTRTMEAPLYGTILPSFETTLRTSYKVDPNGSVSMNIGTYASSNEQMSSTIPAKTSTPKESVLDQFANNKLVNYRKTEYKAPKATEKIESGEVNGSFAKKDETRISTPISDNTGALPIQGQQAIMGAANNSRQIMQRPVEPMIDTTTNDYTAKADASSKSTKANVDYNQLLNKISGLEEKLAASKKAIAPAADTSAVTADPKAIEESDLMKELRNARAALNEAKKFSAEKKSDDDSSGSSYSPTVIRKKIAKEARDDSSDSDSSIITSGSSSAPAAARSIAGVAPAARAAGPASESQVSEKGQSTFDEGKSSARSSNISSSEISGGVVENIVLTRLDGVAHSKANETINGLIASQSGKPFYIEEGGMVKQIIPEVVDGKVLLNEDGSPVYKTVIKGKVGQFKVKTKDKAKAKKEIAKVTSPADVKMQDYQESTPSARYKELQDIFKVKK